MKKILYSIPIIAGLVGAVGFAKATASSTVILDPFPFILPLLWGVIKTVAIIFYSILKQPFTWKIIAIFAVLIILKKLLNKFEEWLHRKTDN